MSEIKIVVTEKGISETDRKLGKLEESGNEAEVQVGKLSKGVEKLGDESKKASKSIDLSAQSLGSMKAKVVAASVAISALTVNATENNKMLERGAYAAGLLTSEYQAMSLASKSVGVDINQLESILGDTEEKIGEFINAGSGGFQDFADAMGLTKSQARQTAIELQGLSGRDVLIEMVRRMEDAGLSSEQMNNALESMGSEARYLLPLLKGNASELNKLEGRFGSLATTIDKETNAKLNELNTVVGIAAGNMQNALASAVASVSTELVFAAENAAFFYASLQAGTVQNITSNMARVNDQIKTTRKELEQLKDEDESFLIGIADAVGITSTQEQIDIREKMLSELESKYKTLQSKYKSLAGLDLPDKPVKKILSPSVSPSDTTTPSVNSADQINSQLEAIRMSYMTQEQLAEAKLQKDLEIIELSKIAEQERIDLSVLAYESYYEKLDELDQQRTDNELREQQRRDREAQKASRDQQKIEDDKNRSTLTAAEATSNAIGAILGRDTDAYRVAATTEATISTYLAANKALANPGGPAGFVLAGAAIANGLANVAQINSARFQGGDVSGGSTYQWQERGLGEAFVPKVDGRVISNAQLKSAMSGGSNSGVTVVNNIYNQTGANVTSVPNDQGGEDIYITRDEFSSMMAAEGGNPDSDFNNSITNVWTMGGRA